MRTDDKTLLVIAALVLMYLLVGTLDAFFEKGHYDESENGDSTYQRDKN